MKNILASILFLLLSSPLSAAVLTTTITVNGYGSSYSEAIQNALIEGLKQTKGVSIESQKVFAKSIKEQAIVSSDGNASHKVAIEKGSQYAVREATKGIIHNYQILNSDREDDEQWNVQVEIQMQQYQTPGISPHRLRKIAVIPFRANSENMDVFGNKISGEALTRKLSQQLVNELTQSRRFTVLDREYMYEYLKERNLDLSANAALSEQVKVGEALGVDYLLIGTVSEFRASMLEKHVKALDEKIVEISSYINVDFRIMVMATRQIKWADTVKIKATKQLRKVWNNKGAQGVVDYMLEEASKKIIHSSLDNIYPVKILKVGGKQSIYLNQGGKITHRGEVYEVYTPGEYVTDPDSGLKIKIDGEKVATIEVVKVQAKYTLAKIISGKLEHILPGAIVRKKTVQHMGVKQRKVRQPSW